MRRREIAKALLMTTGGSALAQASPGSTPASAPGYARTVEELAANVTPVDYGYPVGNILRYGADSSGAASSYSAFVQAIAVCSRTGNTVLVPAGNYRLPTSNPALTCSHVAFKGEGITDGSRTPAAAGSVLSFTGTDTTNSAFEIGPGVTFDGIGFYYPDQLRGNMPIPFSPTIITSLAIAGPINFVYIRNCTVFNAYRFFVDTDLTGTIGHVFFLDNTIYGILACFELAHNAEIITWSGNEFTFGHFLHATETGLRDFTRNHGVVLLWGVAGNASGATDGFVFSDNVCFGYRYGIRFCVGIPIAFRSPPARDGATLAQPWHGISSSSHSITFGDGTTRNRVTLVNGSPEVRWNAAAPAPAASGAATVQTLCQLFSIIGNYFDQVLDCISAEGAGNITGMQLAANSFAAFNPQRVGRADIAFGTALRIHTTGTATAELLVMSGNNYSTTTGHCASFIGDAIRMITIAGNTFTSCGAYQSTGGPFCALWMDGAATRFTCSGNSFLNQAGSPHLDVAIAGRCAEAVINGNTFGQFESAINGQFDRVVATGNTSYTTLGSHSNNYQQSMTVTDINNQWDKPSFQTPSVIPISRYGNHGNDAEAAAGGVPIGGMYRNGSALQVRVR